MLLILLLGGVFSPIKRVHVCCKLWMDESWWVISTANSVSAVFFWDSSPHLRYGHGKHWFIANSNLLNSFNPHHLQNINLQQRCSLWASQPWFEYGCGIDETEASRRVHWRNDQDFAEIGDLCSFRFFREIITNQIRKSINVKLSGAIMVPSCVKIR